MGGKAIKTVPLVRLPAEQYEVTSGEILEKLKSHFPRGDFRVVPAYHGKPDFGDVDILYALNTPGEHQAFHEEILSILGASPSEAKRNGKVLSVAYQVGENRYFQADLIKTTRCDIHFSEFYYGFNDVGHVLGRVARFLGMKLCDDGLYYPFTLEGKHPQVISDILITRDVATALNLLGYRDEDYRGESFVTRRDVFAFLSKGRLFSKEMFLTEHQNHKWRKREKTRPVYSEFLTYLESLSDREDMLNYEGRHMARSEVLQRLLRFDNFKRSYLEAHRQHEGHEAFKRRYNGKKVSEITGLSGNQLGDFMKGFRGQMKKNEFRDYVMSMTEEKTHAVIKEKYKEYLKSHV